MTSRYRCPYCGQPYDTRSRVLNHLFGFHRQLMEERLRMTTSSSRPLKPLRDVEDPEEV